MKKILVILLVLPLLFLCGFKRKEKPYLILSSGAITTQNLKFTERKFLKGQRINYAIVAPDMFKDNGIRLQLVSQNSKTSNWGFTIEQTEDIFIDKTQKIYRNYIVPSKSGHYILQFFYVSSKRYPFAHIEFVVE